mgnify:CR=1 FL=1
MTSQSKGYKLPSESQADRKVARASKGHCTAYAVLGEGEGYQVQAESHLEICNLIVLNADRTVEKLKEQAEFVWVEDRKTKHHFFDVLATYKDKSRIAFTVKPERRVNSGGFLNNLQKITYFALKSGFCDEVRLITEQSINSVDKKNAFLFETARHSDAEAEAVALQVVAGLVGAVSLRELTLRTGMAARGYRALLRLMRTGCLVPIVHEVIKPKTLVCLAEAMQ